MEDINNTMSNFIDCEQCEGKFLNLMKPVYHWPQSLTELGYLNSQQKCEFSKKSFKNDILHI